MHFNKVTAYFTLDDPEPCCIRRSIFNLLGCLLGLPWECNLEAQLPRCAPRVNFFSFLLHIYC